MGSLAQAEFIGSPGSTALSDGSAGAVGTDPSDSGWRSSSLNATSGLRRRVFLASFLVLFLEVALIRWMPAYIRLLAYFSNFILLRAFSASASAACWRRRGGGCSVVPAAAGAVIAAVYFFRLEVAVPTPGSIYFTSGTAAKPVVWSRARCCCRSCSSSWRRSSRRWRSAWAARWRRCRRSAATRINILGSLAGVVVVRRDFVAAAVADVVVRGGVRCRGAAACGRRSQPTARRGRRRARGRERRAACCCLARSWSTSMARGAIWSPYYKITVGQRWPRHRRRGQQHLPPVDGAGGAEGILLPVALHGRSATRSRTC